MWHCANLSSLVLPTTAFYPHSASWSVRVHARDTATFASDSIADGRLMVRCGRLLLVSQAHLLTVEHITSLRSLFEQHDAEHVGSLSSAQLLRLLHACGETQLSEADVQTTLKEISEPTTANSRTATARHFNRALTLHCLSFLCSLQPGKTTHTAPSKSVHRLPTKAAQHSCTAALASRYSLTRCCLLGIVHVCLRLSQSFVYTMTQPFSPISDPPQPHSTEFVLSAATRQTLQAAFRAMDGDGDGRLNSEDVWEALMAVGERVEVDEAEAIVAAIDTTNKQGKKSQNKAITKRDFIRVMTAQ